VVTELQKEGARALSVAADVTKRADVEAMVNHVVGEFGRLDVLVNNAGINRDAMSHKMTEEQWDQVITGTFLCAQAALARMRERGWGRVINTSSLTTTIAPSRANRRAVASPMPLPAPVIRTTRPSSRILPSWPSSASGTVHARQIPARATATNRPASRP
jgi:NAD(P)-dependent dehydrogenase (short-subunit alcohol dehydrogenase family)